MIQCNDHYLEDLTPETTIKIIEDLKAGKEIKAGPQSGRHSSEPKEGRTALVTEPYSTQFNREEFA